MNEPNCRYIYSPVQTAECGGPCEQGPEHCDCGELCVTEPERPTDEELLQVFDTVCLSEGGTIDEIHLRGLRAVLARWGK